MTGGEFLPMTGGKTGFLPMAGGEFLPMAGGKTGFLPMVGGNSKKYVKSLEVSKKLLIFATAIR